jgi:hypothetical protein
MKLDAKRSPYLWMPEMPVAPMKYWYIPLKAFYILQEGDVTGDNSHSVANPICAFPTSQTL